MLFASSSTDSVELIARVLHQPTMPAADQAAGGTQQVEICGFRLYQVTLKICCGEAKSTCQNSALLTPLLL